MMSRQKPKMAIPTDAEGIVAINSLLNGYVEELLVVFRGLGFIYRDILLKYISIPNLEDNIRNIILKDYLQNAQELEKIGLGKYDFDAETVGNVDENYNTLGYMDLKVKNLDTYLEYGRHFYVIECKRIDGNMTLNRAYITDGIARFIDDVKYTSPTNVYGMLGFVIRKIDTIQNITEINNLIGEYNHILLHTNQQIEPYEMNVKLPIFQSKHISVTEKHIQIYHSMLDFSIFF